MWLINKMGPTSVPQFRQIAFLMNCQPNDTDADNDDDCIDAKKE